MEILFITDLYPINASEINTPSTLHNFVTEWIKQGHNVDVIRPNFFLNSILRHKPLYETGFYEFEDVDIFNVNYFTPFWFDVSKKIPEDIDLTSYDVIIAHMPSGIIFANNLLKKADISAPLICGVHCSDIEVLTNSIYKFYFRTQLKEAYKKAKKIACRSLVLQKKFNKLMPELAQKTFVAHSGIEPAELESLNSLRFTFHVPPLKVLTCANLIKRKNIDKLIKAINDLDDFELEIIGDGKEFKKLKDLSRLYMMDGDNGRLSEKIWRLLNTPINLWRLLNTPITLKPHLNRTAKSVVHSQKVYFLGRLSNEEVLKEMRNADIFMLPSENETFGMVYLEAMASGCVTVCTKNDGIDGIITDGENGFLTEPTEEGIKETLLRIKDYNLEKVTQNSLETVKQYTPEICAKNYLGNIL